MTNYQYNFSDSEMSMFDGGIRKNKANKTLSIFSDYFKETSNLKLLDIGSSTGIMTNEYAKYFKTVVGIDIDTKAVDFAIANFQSENLKFICTPIEEISLPKNSFDAITCSHIYEHVPSDEVLLEKIYNLLKPGGVCYFAAGNRFQIIEAHYKLPFLSYFPKKISNIYIRLFTGEKYYYENLKSYFKLRKLVSNFEIIDYTLEVIKHPEKYFAEDILKEKTFKFYLINLISKFFYYIIPTYIWLLKKPT